MAIRKIFDEEIKKLQEALLKMGNLVEEMLYKAIEALAKRDVKLADEVIKKDDEVDELNIKIEEKCINLIALQQPMARDLRFITAVLKIITDVERIGDHCVDIAKFGKQIMDKPLFKPLVDIPKMADLVRKMLRDALQAFVQRDPEKIKQIVQDDDEIDHLHKYLFNELVDFMERDAKLVKQAVYLLLMTRYLERIADHTTNICERIYYMETGEIKELHI